MALSAINSVCRRAAEGRFPRLDDRHDLWRILATVTARKAAEVYRDKCHSTYDDDLLEEVIGREPSPELAAQVSDEVRRLLEALPNEGYRTIAQKKLEGYTSAEIAEDLGCSIKNIEFKLRNIRASWIPLTSEE